MPRARIPKNLPTPAEVIQDNAVAALHSTVTAMQDLMQRVIALADDGMSLKELLQVLDTVGKTSYRLSTLLKNQKQLAGNENLADFLNQALAEVVQEMGESSDRRKPAPMV